MNMTKKMKLGIASIIFAISPVLIALINHPLLHGLYGIIALSGIGVALVLAMFVIRIDREEYYSKLTVDHLSH